jgi:hypothetical protein
LNIPFFIYQFAEFAVKDRRSDVLIVNVMIIAAPGFAADQVMIFESVGFEPILGHLSLFFGPGSEKSDYVPKLIPAVDLFFGSRYLKSASHPFGFFVGYILANDAVDVDYEIF